MNVLLGTTLLILSGPADAAFVASDLAEAWTAVQRRSQALTETGYLEGEGLKAPAFQAVPTQWQGHTAALSGIAAAQDGNTPEAVQHLQLALKHPRLRGPLRQHATLGLGRALLAMEDAAGATDVLAGMLKGSAAKPGARPAPGGVDPAEIRFTLARALRDRGDDAASYEVLKTIWTHNPTSDFAVLAEEQLHGQGPGSIRPDTPEGVALTQKRIRTLERLYMNAEAASLRETLPDQHPMRAPSAFAEAIFKAKDYARAATLLKALPARTPDQDIMLALAYVRSGDPEASIKTYERIARAGNSASQLASYKIGYMAFDQGEWRTAIQAFSTHLGLHGRGKYADAAMWFSALSRLRLGDIEGSNKAFARLEVSHPGSSLRAGAVYWQAQTTASDATRIKMLKRLLSTWPKTGYAWFASHELGVDFPSKANGWTASPLPNLQGTAVDAIEWQMGLDLTDAGLLSWARHHLDALSTKGLNRTQKVGVANALIRAGSYRSAKRLVRSWCGSPDQATDMALIEACWPRPNGDAVQSMASSAGLPDHLPFAIMTAESALDPAVTSPAGARGLMQLMPFLAEELHGTRFADRPFHADEMYEPTYNSILGTTELIRLAEQFAVVGVSTPLPMVIAGYNGGSDAVARWTTSYTATMGESRITNWDVRPSPDVWAEFIGYGETRKYVRRVLGFLQTYRLAYGDPVQPAQAP